MAHAENGKPSAAGKEAAAEMQDRAAGEPQNEGSGKDAIAMLGADHRRVEQLFDEFDAATDPTERLKIAEEICIDLIVHTLIEEEIFYPACRGLMEDRLLDEAQVEHDDTKALILEVKSGSHEDRYFNAKVKVLSDAIRRHIEEEERATVGILAKAKRAKLATPDLARRLAERKRELVEAAAAGRLRPPMTLSFRVAISHPSTDHENRYRRNDGPRRPALSRYQDDDDYRGAGRGRGWYDDARPGWEQRDVRYLEDDDDERRDRRSRRGYEDGWRGRR